MEGRILHFLLAIFLLFISGNAFANSMAPILPALSVGGWLGMPIIIFIEYLYFRKKGFAKPLALSAYGNVFSGLAGIVAAIVTIPLMLGPIIQPTTILEFMISLIATTIGLVFNWWLSAKVEMYFVKKSKWWKDEPLTLKHFYHANALTYSIIALIVYFITFLKP